MMKWPRKIFSIRSLSMHAKIYYFQLAWCVQGYDPFFKLWGAIILCLHRIGIKSPNCLKCKTEIETFNHITAMMSWYFGINLQENVFCFMKSLNLKCCLVFWTMMMNIRFWGNLPGDPKFAFANIWVSLIKRAIARLEETLLRPNWESAFSLWYWTKQIYT